MFILNSYTLAVVFCFITMLCWGSWANTQKLAASTWRFELFYWDYVTGILFFALLSAFTLGSIGNEGRPFLEDLVQADSAHLLSAFFGGILFNAANILLVAAIAIAGMAVAFPVGIGLALVIGVVVNYINSPLGDARLLFIGVAFITVAIIVNASAYWRVSSSDKGLSAKGLVLSVISGGLMGLFYKYVAGSMFQDFSVPEEGMLSPYTAVFIFSTGIFASNFIFNTILMYKAFQGSRVSFTDYFKGTFRDHSIGWLGGIIWCLGMSFSILASDKAGPAISYGLGQGATVVAALWGIYIWKEFEGEVSVKPLLNTMLVSYVTGLVLIIISR